MFLDFYEVAEGYAAAEAGAGDDQVGKAASGGIRRRVIGGRVGDVVDVVLIMGIGQFLWLVVRYFWEYQRGKTGCLRGGRGGVFSQNSGAISYAGAARSRREISGRRAWKSYRSRKGNVTREAE